MLGIVSEDLAALLTVEAAAKPGELEHADRRRRAFLQYGRL